MYQVGESGNTFKTFSPGVCAVVFTGWASLSLAGGGRCCAGVTLRSEP